MVIASHVLSCHFLLDQQKPLLTPTIFFQDTLPLSKISVHARSLNFFHSSNIGTATEDKLSTNNLSDLCKTVDPKMMNTIALYGFAWYTCSFVNCKAVQFNLGNFQSQSNHFYI